MRDVEQSQEAKQTRILRVQDHTSRMCETKTGRDRERPARETKRGAPADAETGARRGEGGPGVLNALRGYPLGNSFGPSADVLEANLEHTKTR